ncbi:hypothetical protein P692DRAFT_20892810 [Suillus brevipes Sb2]|nr:hypothetical protein P692DRAFT_20892810 [Suillus brevipes Sb2]
MQGSTRNRHQSELDINLHQRRRCYTPCEADTFSHSLQVSDFRCPSRCMDWLIQNGCSRSQISCIFLVLNMTLWLSTVRYAL